MGTTGGRGLVLLVLLALGGACRDTRLTGAPQPPPGPRCGDGRIDPGERCDGASLGGRSCAGEGFDTGTLACAPDCFLDVSGCVRYCGNEVIDPGEACDGAKGPLGCDTFGFKACSASCQVEASHCVTDAFGRLADEALGSGGAALLVDLEPQGSGELVVAVPSQGQFLLIPYSTSGTRGVERRLGKGTAPLLPLALDIDADGRVDLASVDADGRVHRYPFDPGTGGYGLTRLYDGGECHARAWVGALPRSGAAGVDLVAAAACPGTEAAPGALLVLPAEGNATATRLDVPGLAAAAVADLDGDGRAELLLAAGGAELRTRERDGTGFTGGPTYPLGLVPVSLAVADFDGDGATDVAASDGAQVQVLRNAGGALTPAATFTGSGAHLLAEDVDGDGRADLLWVDRDSGGRAVLHIERNQGALAFRARPLVTDAGGTPLSLAVGDLDIDGDMDVALTVREATEGSRTVLFRNKVR